MHGRHTRSGRILYLLALSAIALLLAATAPPAVAHRWVFRLLHSFANGADFGGTDGSQPLSGLVIDKSGNLFGATFAGGANGGGTVFEVTPDGRERVVYSFCAVANCADGQYPNGVIMDASGNLYGTTYFGGANAGGALFEVMPDGRETVLHSFCSPQCADAWGPASGLIMDAAGDLYGTAELGGANGGGTVFELTRGGVERVLYSFGSAENFADGFSPIAGLLMGSGGVLYGTTLVGGANDGGTAFALRPGGETVLHSFCSVADCADGFLPSSVLIADRSGNLYGTAQNSSSGTFATDGGTVFQLTPEGVETVLYTFCSLENCLDGRNPWAGLLGRRDGSLFGTTYGGGAFGYGTVFRIAPGGSERVLHSFCSAPNCLDGQGPVAPLIMDRSGNLYGTTQAGGAYRGGTVFELVCE
ncbi:MAG TPA: choice-of-anchor tandem repeat GloVer-containing protein [Stellaceae bacterium]|nr:choice-of-anchor tandem repeat GloVer-containing protein [Stellaceae bacterium]